MTQPSTHIIPIKTPAAARALGVTYHVLRGLLRFDKLDPLPQRDSSGDYLWFPDDMERARELLADRRLALPPPTLPTVNAN
jgi:hypothetical protein